MKWYTEAFSLCSWRQHTGRTRNTLKKNTEALVVASKEIILEVYADKN